MTSWYAVRMLGGVDVATSGNMA